MLNIKTSAQRTLPYNGQAGLDPDFVHGNVDLYFGEEIRCTIIRTFVAKVGLGSGLGLGGIKKLPNYIETRGH